MIKKDFKQKYFLFCREKEFKVGKFGNVNNNSYICRKKQIKIEEL